jgi:hypothetical protein
MVCEYYNLIFCVIYLFEKDINGFPFYKPVYALCKFIKNSM